MKNNKNYERMKWACRRGMLELDLFLIPFFENSYATLTVCEKELFNLLLGENDPDLFSWFMGNNMPPTEFNLLVNKIRAYRQFHSKHFSF